MLIHEGLGIHHCPVHYDDWLIPWSILLRDLLPLLRQLRVPFFMSFKIGLESVSLTKPSFDFCGNCLAALGTLSTCVKWPCGDGQALWNPFFLLLSFSSFCHWSTIWNDTVWHFQVLWPFPHSDTKLHLILKRSKIDHGLKNSEKNLLGEITVHF